MEIGPGGTQTQRSSAPHNGVTSSRFTELSHGRPWTWGSTGGNQQSYSSTAPRRHVCLQGWSGLIVAISMLMPSHWDDLSFNKSNDDRDDIKCALCSSPGLHYLEGICYLSSFVFRNVERSIILFAEFSWRHAGVYRLSNKSLCYSRPAAWPSPAC